MLLKGKQNVFKKKNEQTNTLTYTLFRWIKHLVSSFSVMWYTREKERKRKDVHGDGREEKEKKRFTVAIKIFFSLFFLFPYNERKMFDFIHVHTHICICYLIKHTSGRKWRILWLTLSYIRRVIKDVGRKDSISMGNFMRIIYFIRIIEDFNIQNEVELNIQ